MDRGAGQATVHGVSESDTTERLSTAQQKEGVGFVRDGGYTSECTRQDPSYYTLKLRGFCFLHLKKKKKREEAQEGRSDHDITQQEEHTEVQLLVLECFSLPREFGSYVSDAIEARIPSQPRGPTRLPARSELHPPLPGLAAAAAASRAKTRSPLQALPGRSPLCSSQPTRG